MGRDGVPRGARSLAAWYPHSHVTPTVSRAHFDAFVFDLDGTLLDAHARLSTRTLRCVRALVDEGWLVVLATGRSLAGTREIHDALGLSTQICAYNGAWIGGRDGIDPWHYDPIPDGLVPDLRGLEGRARFLFRHCGARKFTARPTDPLHVRVANWFAAVEAVDAAHGPLPERDLVRVSLFFDGRPAVDAAWGALSPAAQAGLHRQTFPMAIFPGFEDVDLHLCEVQRKGRGKAEVYRYLAEHHGVPAHRVVAVGDQLNDLPLLRDAGLPVAMGNAVDELRAIARLVIGDHRDDGIARFLEETVLLRTTGGGGGGARESVRARGV